MFDVPCCFRFVHLRIVIVDEYYYDSKIFKFRTRPISNSVVAVKISL